MFCLYSLIFCFVELQFKRKWKGGGGFLSIYFSLPNGFGVFGFYFHLSIHDELNPNGALCTLEHGEAKELVVGIVHSACQLREKKAHTHKEGLTFVTNEVFYVFSSSFHVFLSFFFFFFFTHLGAKCPETTTSTTMSLKEILKFMNPFMIDFVVIMNII
jgi:hypothetical protein